MVLGVKRLGVMFIGCDGSHFRPTRTVGIAVGRVS